MQSSGLPTHAFVRYLLAIAASFAATVLAIFIPPFDDFSPQTPGRAVLVAVFIIIFF
jgi:hypothetical protein